MIAYIEGTPIEVQEDRCVILTRTGVGYEVFIPSSLGGDILKGDKRDISLYIKTVVREDAIDLYGFASLEEKHIFCELVRISKLGPKTAMAILSHLSPGQIYDAVVKGDEKSLCRVPGIGKKTARRIIWEIKDKVCSISPPITTSLEYRNGIFSDALSALVNLGYGTEEVEPLLKEILSSEPDLMVEEAVRAVLKKKGLSKEG